MNDAELMNRLDELLDLARTALAEKDQLQRAVETVAVVKSRIRDRARIKGKLSKIS